MCRFLMWAYKCYSPVLKKWQVNFLQKVEPNDNYDKIRYVIHNLSTKKGLTMAVPIQIPCGQCIECRLARSRDWANRCMLESKYHKDNYFITLTYDNEHLPKGQKIDFDTGEILVEESGTLNSKDLQDFMKRLRITWKRKYNIENIRFFACGEYGDQYARPHYHAIIFGLPIFDLKADHKSKKGNMNYTSEEISQIWGKGRIAIGSVTWDSCAYTARYVLKKFNGKHSKAYYDFLGKSAEFVRMSRKPGLAKAFYDEKRDIIYSTDEIFISTNKGVQRVKPSRYYDKLFDIDDSESLKSIKKNRQALADLKHRMKYFSTDIDPSEYEKNSQEYDDLRYATLRRKFEKESS